MTYRVTFAVLSALFVCTSAHAQIITTLAKLPAVKTSGPSIFITDAGKEGLFISTGTAGTADNAITINDGNGVTYRRHITGPINAGWWLNKDSIDNSDAMDEVLKYAKNGSEISVPSGRYRFSRPILLSEDKRVKLVSDGTLIFESSHGIIVRGRQVLEIENIEGHPYEETPDYPRYYNSGLVLEDAAHSDIRVNLITGFERGIHLTSTGKQGTGSDSPELGTQYNRITFNNVANNRVGIYFTTGKVSSTPGIVEGAKPWVNENTITGGSIRAETGILTLRGRYQNDLFNGNKFYNIGFEKNSLAFDMQYARNNMIIAPRFENNAAPMKFAASSRGNVMIVSEMYRESLAADPGYETVVIGSVMKTGGSLTGPIEAVGVTKTDPVQKLRAILTNVPAPSP